MTAKTLAASCGPPAVVAAPADDATTLPIRVLRPCAPSVDVDRLPRLVAVAEAAPSALHGLASQLQVMGGVEVMAELVADGPLPLRDASTRAIAAWRRAEALFSALRRFLRHGEVVRRPVGLDRVVALAIDQVAPQAAAATVRGGDGGAVALISDALIGHAVVELLRNALRATPAGGHVDVGIEEVESDPAAVAIVVTDDGPGAPADVVAHLADPLASLDAGTAGNGLVAVALIAALHGGTLEVRPAPGRGARFALVLPRG